MPDIAHNLLLSLGFTPAPEDDDSYDRDAELERAKREADQLLASQGITVRLREPDEDERPVHRPPAPEAPIPGRNYYAGCDPDLPRVDTDGVCEGCGERACPVCGHGFWPDGRCACV